MGKPEIRFKGYTDEWEQRKFGDLVEKYEDPVVTPTEGYTRLGIRSHAKGTFHSYVEKGKELETAKMFRVASDKFIVNITFGWEHAVAITDENDAGKLVSHRFPQYSFNAGMIPKFFRYLILDKKFKHHLELSSPGGAGRNRVLKLSDMLEYKMNFPCEEEQRKIAAYFDDLDHLITLHQRKCDEVKSLKKYMLQKMFPQNEQKVPEIRFEGFTEAWEQRKLGDVLDDMYNGQTPSRNKSEYWNGNIKWLSSGELNRGTVYDSMEMITEDGQKSANLRIVPKGTFIMAITGLEAAGTRGNCALLGFDTTLNQSCMALFPKKDLLTSDFLFQWYRKVGEEYGINYTQGTKQQSYNAELIKILPISLPSVAEQRKIASYLSNLDHLITLHQRKCDEVKSLKKYMLQKMFPQNEQKVPEIRFEGFTEAWEQRKLGDVLDDMYNGQTPSRNKSEYWNGNIKWLSSGELNRGTVYDSMEMITEDGQKSANLRIVPKGTFIMAITGLEAAGTRGNCALLGFDTTLNQSCMALFPKKDLLTSDFLFQWYRKVGEEYGINYTQGTKQQSYNAELIKILPISLPSVAEQRKIASYLSNLDHLITLHQQKCEELKKIKKFMLQKMFV